MVRRGQGRGSVWGGGGGGGGGWGGGGGGGGSEVLRCIEYRVMYCVYIDRGLHIGSINSVWTYMHHQARCFVQARAVGLRGGEGG